MLNTSLYFYILSRIKSIKVQYRSPEIVRFGLGDDENDSLELLDDEYQIYGALMRLFKRIDSSNLITLPDVVYSPVDHGMHASLSGNTSVSRKSDIITNIGKLGIIFYFVTL